MTIDKPCERSVTLKTACLLSIAELMDGIPVKINEKYKPPRKLTLPSCILNRLNNVQFTSFTYDFSLETTVAEHMSRLNQISKEELDKHEVKNNSEKSSTNSMEKFEGTTNEPVMLTPVPTPISSNQEATPLKNIFQYSDFENDTSSPFDNEELKTINEMEELAHVLGATSVSQNHRLNEESSLGKEWISAPRSIPSQGGFYGNNSGYTAMSTPSLSRWCPTSVQYSSSYQPQSVTSSNTVENPIKDDNSTNKSDKSDKDVSRGIVKSLHEFIVQRKIEHKPNSTLKDASFTNLTDQERETARTVGEMGFPLSRTTAVVQLFGTDQSKIIEYLLLVQSFIDKGFTEPQILHALEVNQCDETNTEKYLKILSQIMKLGFEEEDVVNALARTSHDRDKALDILIRFKK